MIEPGNLSCPTCGKRVSFRRLLLGSGRVAFTCGHCGARLVKKTSAAWIGLVGFTAVWLVQVRYGYASWITWAAFAVVAAVIVAISLRLVRIRLATADDPDPPPKETMPPGPPPLDPTFRGSSGPPPKADG
jgi:uncharacterized protein (DUF983 family)